ncbi:MAG: nucleoside deaminase [Verrucomicrobia bacterium]|jgi:tRNA(Arg) A34 adenosine deaminase TadA|nr:nucleoside deaminase [Verrucomicrobiota bacterium]MBT7068779.1 nucleoside deaminase [Verrucomicrobiota bacterium]MBT7698852.1 nucleoside deaminase [Verrucomicrobiota bacterium]
MTYPTFTLSLPAWLTEAAMPSEHSLATIEARMTFVIELARRNSEAGTGGPFAAAVFDLTTHRLLAPGVNRVTTACCSSAHAEIVALSIAQQRIGHYDLGGPGRPPYELVTSTEPCAMCLGAVPWSGVRALVCGARGDDAAAIGMDEGAKPADWVAQLEQRGIRVTRDICRTAAASVLTQYQRSGGEIYNARQAN